MSCLLCVQTLIQGASSSLYSDDDNCSLSITRKRCIFPHRYAFDTPVFITSERLARAQRDLAESTSQIRVKRNDRAFVKFGWTVCAGSRYTKSGTVKPERNQTESFGAVVLPSYWAERNWKKGMRPELMPPCVYQEQGPVIWCVNFQYV